MKIKNTGNSDLTVRCFGTGENLTLCPEEEHELDSETVAYLLQINLSCKDETGQDVIVKFSEIPE